MPGELPYHVPVLLDSVLAVLYPQPGQVFVDCTVGGGGHARAIAERIQPGGRLIGLDQDAEALAEAGRVLAPYAGGVTLVQGRFDSLDVLLARAGVGKLDGALFDLGVSSHQLDTPRRGFSFKEPSAPLDMRMNPAGGGATASDLLNALSERGLTALLRDNADEKWAVRIAQFVVERRQQEPYITVGQLIETVHAAIPARARPADIHAATRTFQALRIAVNAELDILEQALSQAVDRLAAGGVLAALSYHSGEDRIIKQLFARLSGRGDGEGVYGTRPNAVVEMLTRKPLLPTQAEVAANPRSRSAKLRAVRRL